MVYSERVWFSDEKSKNEFKANLGRAEVKPMEEEIKEVVEEPVEEPVEEEA